MPRDRATLDGRPLLENVEIKNLVLLGIGFLLDPFDGCLQQVGLPFPVPGRFQRRP